MEKMAKETPDEASERLFKQKLSEAELIKSGEVNMSDSNETGKKRRQAKKQFKEFIDNLGQKELFPKK